MRPDAHGYVKCFLCGVKRPASELTTVKTADAEWKQCTDSKWCRKQAHGD